MRLKDKVALVTGSSSGIGQAIAELFAEQGAQVLAADIAEPGTPFAASAVSTISLDVTREDHWRATMDHALSQYGRLDVLVNNAGVIGYAGVEDIDIDEWNRVIAINQTGVLLGMRVAVPALRAAGGGSIVNTASIWGSSAVAGAAAYHASKGAVRNLTKNAAVSYAADNIRVNSVHPGIVNTPMVRAADTAMTDAIVQATPMGRIGEPREIAYAYLFLASDESSFVTGAELAVDGGYLAR